MKIERFWTTGCDGVRYSTPPVRRLAPPPPSRRGAVENRARVRPVRNRYAVNFSCSIPATIPYPLTGINNPHRGRWGCCSWVLSTRKRPTGAGQTQLRGSAKWVQRHAGPLRNRSGAVIDRGCHIPHISMENAALGFVWLYNFPFFAKNFAFLDLYLIFLRRTSKIYSKIY